MAVKGMIREIRQDRHCVIFPEGRITVTGSLMKVYEGPGMIADKSGAQILPVRIDGAQYSPFSRIKAKVPHPLLSCHYLDPAGAASFSSRSKDQGSRAPKLGWGPTLRFDE
jgi:acyl-[acyl-carrier-protein]-phospholipid O-acyltransferase/long-chain-fatty-acid--[acyl-carrier-protein] ligase